MYNFDFKGAIYSFDKKEQDKDKFLVFTCAKNEDEYIIEWINHYLRLGFDKIIIADNNDDNTKLPSLLHEYISNEKVQIFDCHGMVGFQLNIYNMFLKEGNYLWCAYFDCDEFLELNVHKDIKDFLSNINEDCVLINWMLFGSNGIIHKKNSEVQNRFSIPVSPINFFKENMYVKPIIRGKNNYTWLTDTHTPLGNNVTYNIGGYYTVDYSSHVYYPPRYKYAYIKHYYTKSFTEWVSNKTKRGWPDEMPKILRESNYFILQNKENFPIEKFTNGLFVDNNYYESIKSEYKDAIENYDLIEFRASTKNIYALELMVFSFMAQCDNHVFVIRCEDVDDTLYNEFLEYSFSTTNKVIFSRNEGETWKIMEKYSQNKLYYFFDCK